MYKYAAIYKAEQRATPNVLFTHSCSISENFFLYADNWENFSNKGFLFQCVLPHEFVYICRMSFFSNIDGLFKSDKILPRSESPVRAPNYICGIP